MAKKKTLTRDNLSSLSLEELADNYNQIDLQGSFMKGAILLEGKNKCKDNQSFGEWRGENFPNLDPITASRQMNVARRFFDEKEVMKLGNTAAKFIAEPRNDEISEELIRMRSEDKATVSDLKNYANSLKAPKMSEKKEEVASKKTKPRPTLSQVDLDKIYASVEEDAKRKRNEERYHENMAPKKKSAEVMRIANALYSCDEEIVSKVKKYLTQLIHPDKAGSDKYKEAFHKLNGVG